MPSRSHICQGVSWSGRISSVSMCSCMELTRQSMKTDRRAVPRVGERVPYVVVYGEPGLPLIQLVRHPHTLLEQPHLRINSQYYITKVIAPPLNRCLLLVGVDCLAWFSELP